jgi:hypothetical protein
MPLVWVTGNAGTGKSTVCELLKDRGEFALDADWAGYSQWFDRTSGQVVVDPPYPVPPGWLDRFAWRINRAKVAELGARASDTVAFLCGSVENEVDVWNLFDLVICLVADNQTLRERLAARSTNAFGRRPEELAAVMVWNEGAEETYRGFGATIIDARRPRAEVVDAVLAATTRRFPFRRPAGGNR